MKKVLFASTALVAAGLMTATGASASEKIKLNLGGFSKWWVVGAWQDDSYQNGLASAAGNTNVAAGDYASVDVKGDNEIFFGGSTTLDNGIKVGIQVELEAGGHTETTNAATADVIDESYVFIETGFGKFIVGSENNGTYLLHTQAPDAAGNWGEGGIMTGGAAIEVPANVSSVSAAQRNWNTTAIVTDNDADKITYVAPTFYGLTVGGSYAPSVVEDNRGLQVASEVFGAGALYANTFGGVGVKVSAGWAQYDTTTNQFGTTLTNGTLNTGNNQETAFGTQLSYAGFTLGGSFRNVNGNQKGDLLGSPQVSAISLDAQAWDVGLQYASGPYAISLAYYQSKADGTIADPDDDKITFWQASGKYTLGAGVDVLASAGYAEFDDESDKVSGRDANHNEGWTVMTGLGLTF